MNVEWVFPDRRKARTAETLCDLLDLYIDVPAPFKKGDIVEPIPGIGLMRVWCSPCVLDWLSYEGDKHLSKILQGDLMDMSVDGHVEEDREILVDDLHFYPDLQYCRRELEGDQRILEYLSMYEQGKINLCDLLKIQEYIFLDTECRQHQDHYATNCIIKEKLNEPLPWDPEETQ
jgi:hypothetical protein